MDELWLTLLTLLVVVGLAALPIALRAQRRIEALENRLAALEAQSRANNNPAQAVLQPSPVIRHPEPTTEHAGKDPFAEPAPPPRDLDIVHLLGGVGSLATWVTANWVLLLSALSLVTAGGFLIHYGLETGLLTPQMRVLGALTLGLTFCVGAEWLRRREGPQHLPAMFAGAGVAVLFLAVLGARQLYGLIGPELGFAGLVVVAAGALALGWLHGPLLMVLGLTGGMAAPFVVGGDSTVPWWLYGYFLLLSGVGLGVDALRHSGWVSVLALVAGMGARCCCGWGRGVVSGWRPACLFMWFWPRRCLAAACCPPIHGRKIGPSGHSHRCGWQWAA